MHNKRRTLIIPILVTALFISGCGLGQFLGPKVTPVPTATITPIATITSIPTITPLPSPTPQPGIGVSLQSFQSSFEEIGFTFNTFEDNRVQADFTSADFLTWVILVVQGQPEDLSSAYLTVLNGTDQEKVAQILNVFFRVTFPVQSERDEAMDWFANKSGINSGLDKGETIIGKIKLGWAKDNVAGYGVFVTPLVP